MDPLSVTASTIAIIGLAENIISGCKAYVSAVKDAPNDLCNILIEVGSVKCIVETLEMRRKISPSQNSDIIERPLEGCSRALKALKALLPDLPPKRKRGGVNISYAQLAWPFKEGKARKILEDLGRHKATLILVLTTDSGQDIKKIKSHVEGITDTLNNQQRDTLLRWLVITDPSSNHNRACQLHESHTGQWLLRSTEYSNWLAGSTRLLWLHGIPGAGKTILASFIIQDVQRFCKTSDLNDTAWAYYYCYFGHDQDETSPSLRWIIGQLCRQLNYVPEELRSLWDDGIEPCYEDLINVLSVVVGKFRRVYLVLDALDESQNRRFLLDLVIGIASEKAFENVHILATSRKEMDIQRALEGIDSSVSLSNPLVDEDISVYIANQLRADRKLSRWPEDLKNEIKYALVEGAKGMFRWVACQLDILSRVNSRTQIQKALRELPETLEETYERILVNIPSPNRLIAHKALQILAVEHDMKLTELAEAVIVDIDNCSFSTDSRFLEPEALLEICTCLVTSNDSDVHLAHYTVAEYLTSKRILNGPATGFKLSMNKARNLATRIFIVYLSSITYDKSPTYDEDYFNLSNANRVKFDDEWRLHYPLIDYAQQFCKDRLHNVEEQMDACTIQQILRLFDPREAHFKGFEKQLSFHGRDEGYEYFRLGFTPGAELSMALAYHCYYSPIGVVEELLKRNPNSSILKNRLEPFYDGRRCHNAYLDVEGPPLQVAAISASEEIVELFIRYGADPSAGYKGWTVLTSTLRSKHDNAPHGLGSENYEPRIALLLKAGADPDPPGVCKTPLQLAIERLHSLEVVKWLLEAGVDVNAVGDKDAVVVDMQARLEEDKEDTRGDSKSIESYYDTPLRIAEKMAGRRASGPGTVWRGSLDEDEFSKLEELLLQYGAMSASKAPPDG